MGIDVILPLVGIMLIGFLAGISGLLDRAASQVFSRFVFYIAMPAFIFISLAGVSLGDFFYWPFLQVLGGGMLLIYCASLIVARLAFPDSMAAHGLHALTAMFSSTAYIGLPVILIVFGADWVVPGIVGAVITVAIFMPITILIAEIDRGRSKDKVVFATLRTVLKNPLLLATFAGLSASAAGIGIPPMISQIFELLGDAFIPCALFSAGLFVAGCSVRGGLKEISWLVFAKLFLHPLITWWLGFYVFELDRTLAVIAVLQAALPSGVPVFILAQHYNTFVLRSSTVIMVSTILSIVTLSLLMLWLV